MQHKIMKTCGLVYMMNAADNQTGVTVLNRMRTIESGQLSHRAPEISVRNAGSRSLSTRATPRQEQETKNLRHSMIVPPTPLAPGLFLLEHDKKNY